MTEQQACTLCGAGGHTAAQCNWNKAECAQVDLHPDLKRVYDVIGLHYSHPVSILIANFENTKRFAELLHAVEREFFMVPGEPSDEPEDEGCEPDDVCLMNCWGSTQEQYIEQFREALAVVQARAALAQPSPAPELERPVAVAYRSSESGNIYEQDYGLTNPEPLMEVAQHDRIIGAMREQYECNSAIMHARTEALSRVTAERNAAQANVDALAVQVLKLGGTISFSAPVAQAGQVPEVQVCKLGTYGKAYDLPETKRAYTYAEQPDNLGASRLGSALSAAIAASAGDQIDRGLALLRELQAKGFGVFELNAAPAQGGE